MHFLALIGTMWGEELGGEGGDKKCQRREEFLCSVVSHCRESFVCYGMVVVHGGWDHQEVV